MFYTLQIKKCILLICFLVTKNDEGIEGGFFMSKNISKTIFTMVIMVAFMVIFSLMSAVSVSAESYPNGWFARVDHESYPVYSGPSTAYGIQDYVLPYEGVSVLSATGNVYRIEYSNPSGTQRGYLIGASFSENDSTNTAVEKVISTSTVYAGPSASNYATIGTVYSGEFVAEIRANSGWSYIEYNTSNGRKRGYVPTASLTNVKNVAKSFYTSQDHGTVFVGGSNNNALTVYAGPSEAYAVIGSVGNEYVHVYQRFTYGSGRFEYITYEYLNTGKLKSGYILINE